LRLPRELATRLPVGNSTRAGICQEAVAAALQRRGAALMGILNVTPDSFSDGGAHLPAEAARARIDALLAEGADLLDIGGESSRPGSEPVPAPVQIERIEPAVRHALARGAVVSVDTASPEVANFVLELGAHAINDVSCLNDVELGAVAARHEAVLIVMHSRGPMSQMSGFSEYPDAGYRDVVGDVLAEWRSARDRAVAAGMPGEHVWLDPGLGFAKNARHSCELLARAAELSGEGVPVVLGPSRKSFLAAADGAPPGERLGGTIAACLLAVERGASVLRVHDVFAVRQALDVARAASPGRGA
jgi:dihydropteroate synthase